MNERSQTLTRACAPLLLYLTAFRRNASSSTLSAEELRQALMVEFERARAACEESPRLAKLFERARYALVATVDQVVLGSTWPHRAAWSMKLMEQQVFGSGQGGRKFYAFADEVLAEPSAEAAELAELLFTCMGLGFQGELIGERAELERRRRQLYEKAQLVRGQAEVLTPAAYGRNSTREAPRLPTAGILRLVLVCVGASLFAYLAALMSVKLRTDDVRGEIRARIEHIHSTQE